MTKIGIGTYALMAALLFWGVLVGGIVFSNLILMPVFLGDLPASAAVVNGPYAVNEGPFWIYIHPLVITSTLIALATNWKAVSRRKLVSTSLVLYVVMLVATALYFVPELMAFVDSAKSNVPAGEWAARARNWQILSAIRGVVILFLYLQMLLALTRSESSAGS
ncbi:MAG: hypothetical protein ACKVQJ_13220 [Pyrinomonadaceae bacterium]